VVKLVLGSVVGALFLFAGLFAMGLRALARLSL
jgi:hypothetical protein